MIVMDQVWKGFRSKNGEVNWVIKNFSATFRKGENIGILAPRGHGKSVLVDLICGNERITKGDILRTGRVSLPYGFRGHLTNRMSLVQNLRFMCDIYGRNYQETLNFVDEFGEIGRHLKRSFNQCPIEVRGRFSASALLAMDFDHIIIDEALSHGDIDFRKKCLEYLERNRDRTACVVATSSPSIVKRLCSRAGVLNDGEVTFYDNVNDAVNSFNEINKVFV